jgi:hypothetical protein
MNRIFEFLTENKDMFMNKFIYKMIDSRANAEDFYHDLYILMADKDESKMLGILDRGEMEAYMYIIIRNNLQSKSSRYYYTYRKPNFKMNTYVQDFDVRESYDNIGKVELLDLLDSSFIKLSKDIDKYWKREIKKKPKLFYDKVVFDLYYNDSEKKTSFRKLGEKLDIPSTSIFNTVTASRNKILSIFKEDIKNIKDNLIYYHTEFDDSYSYGQSHKLKFITNDDY